MECTHLTICWQDQGGEGDDRMMTMITYVFVNTPVGHMCMVTCAQQGDSHPSGQKATKDSNIEKRKFTLRLEQFSESPLDFPHTHRHLTIRNLNVSESEILKQRSVTVVPTQPD